MKKILIMGANGYIGSHLTGYLCDQLSMRYMHLVEKILILIIGHIIFLMIYIKNFKIHKSLYSALGT